MKNQSDIFSTSTAITFPGFFARCRSDLLGENMQERGVQSHRIPYPLEQLRQLVALHVAHPELLAEDRSPNALLLEAIAKVDMRRLVLDPLHRGQEIELTSLLNEHNSSNSLSHCTQRNSYIGIDTHLWGLQIKKQHKRSPA